LNTFSVKELDATIFQPLLLNVQNNQGMVVGIQKFSERLAWHKWVVGQIKFLII
jgi:hypothetical protein